MENVDILIIGSGISGLFFAVKIAAERPDLSIAILTKTNAEKTNTRLAQGGIAVVTDNREDNFEQHIEDTLRAGGGACDKGIVEMVIRQAPKRLQELVDFGVDFDKNQQGEWDLGLEGGHSQARILHHMDSSGLEIQEKLLLQLRNRPNIHLLENIFALDLIHEENTCKGIQFLDLKRGTTDFIRAKTTLLCSGGCGQLFKNTTNPKIATGDGVAMAYRAGAELKDLQYIQFHPTAFYEQNRNPNFLISEAVRGFGAHIVNYLGERFLFESDSRGELATRDIISQAIGKELIKSEKKCVYMDCRHLNQQSLSIHFPNISNYCRKQGINLQKDLIPIVPVAHYQCGGIAVNQHAQTSIEHLFAIGECACTSLHGRNRLASNSLLEALVFAHQAVLFLMCHIDKIPPLKTFERARRKISQEDNPNLNLLKNELKSNMTALFLDQAEKTNARSNLIDIERKAAKYLQSEPVSLELVEFRNMVKVAGLIVRDKFDASQDGVSRFKNKTSELV